MGGAALAADQKKADDEGRTLLFVDESAFYLLPMAVKNVGTHGANTRGDGSAPA